MTDNDIDDLIDEATHAVNNLIPDVIIAKMSDDQRTDLLVRINNALTPILQDILED